MATSVSEKSTDQATGRYLYAIIDGETDEAGFEALGLDQGRVYSIGDGKVSAVVSDLPDGRIRPERRKLAAHHEVLKHLMRHHTVLPMAFGLIADGPYAVLRILKLNRAAFRAQILRVRGKVEMGLRANWDVANIFEHALRMHPELRFLRDHVFRDGRTPSQDEKIELGQMFDRLLSEDRADFQERVEHALRPGCAEIIASPVRNEREIMNLACLIEAGRRKDFEQRVIHAAGLFDNSLAFDFNGPWPPHNFVKLELEV
jgi:hypothetical protein